MKRIILFCGIPAIIFLFIMNSCATTSLTSVWMDNTYQGGALKNILIIGVIRPYTLREFFEDELVQQLKAKGTNGIASYTAFSDERMTKKEIESKIEELDIDSVLVARLVDVKNIESYETYETYNPYGAYDLYSSYALWCQYTISIGYNVKFETKIFDAKKGKLIWSMLSETKLERTRENITKSFITAITKDLLNKKLLQ